MKPGTERVCRELFALRDEGYRQFHIRLVPTVDPETVIGVRVPAIRALAKQIAGTPDAEEFLSELPHRRNEENDLHAALLEHIRDYDTALAEVERFLPFLDNWATCDSFCPKVLLSKKNRARTLPLLRQWLASDRVYTARFALVRLMNWLDNPFFEPGILEDAARVSGDDYYIRMAQAWFFCEALIRQYDAALPYLTGNRLGVWVHNKTIRKAVESYRFPEETKSYLKSLARTEEPLP